MGNNSLPNVVGDAVSLEDINAPRAALRGAHVPRNVAGDPERAAADLGTPLFPWKDIHANRIFIDGMLFGDSNAGGAAAASSGGIVSGATLAVLENTSGFLYPLADGRIELFASEQTPLVFTDQNNTEIRLTSPVHASFPASTIGRLSTGNFSILKSYGLNNSLFDVNYGGVSDRDKKLIGLQVGDEIFVGFLMIRERHFEHLSYCQKGATVTANSRVNLSIPIPGARDNENNRRVIWHEAYYLFIDPNVNNPQITVTKEIFHSHNTPPTDPEVHIWRRGKDNSFLVRSGNDFIAYQGIFIGIAVVGPTGCIGAIPSMTSSAAALYARSPFGIKNGELSGWTATFDTHTENNNQSGSSGGCAVNLGVSGVNTGGVLSQNFNRRKNLYFDFADNPKDNFENYESGEYYYCYIDLITNQNFISYLAPLRRDINDYHYYCHPYRVAAAVASFTRLQAPISGVFFGGVFAIEEERSIKMNVMDFNFWQSLFQNFSTPGEINFVRPEVDLEVDLLIDARRIRISGDGGNETLPYGDFELVAEEWENETPFPTLIRNGRGDNNNRIYDRFKIKRIISTTMSQNRLQANGHERRVAIMRCRCEWTVGAWTVQDGPLQDDFTNVPIKFRMVAKNNRAIFLQRPHRPRHIRAGARCH